MIMTVPQIATVADLQRKYRSLVDKIKKTGEPLVIVNNGQPDVVVMDTAVYNAKILRLNELEEEYLLRVIEKGMEEHKKGKTIRLGKNQKLSELIG